MNTIDATVSDALKKAYNLGQRYWQQADSDYESEHKKSDLTALKFKTLVADTEATLRAALTEAQMVQPALTDIDALAHIYSSIYASPHHITFTVDGLRNMIQAAITQPVQPPSKALSDGELCVLLVEIDPETKRLPSGFRRFARAIEAAHGIGAQE